MQDETGSTTTAGSRGVGQPKTTIPGPSRYPTILLLGATGFIGSHILAALNATSKADVRRLTRRPTGFVQACDASTAIGDITDRASLMRALEGVDVVINAASYVGTSHTLADQVNRLGTVNLVQACADLGITRIVHMGTTSVYGSGPHRGLTEAQSTYGPESAVSISRKFADETILDAGGTVVRPNLVYGCGDRWFVPGLISMFQAIGGTIGGSQAELSLIDAPSLGELVASIATATKHHPGALHAADPRPVPVSQLLRLISDNILPLDIATEIPIDRAFADLKQAGFSTHQINLIAMDHWYESKRLWEMAGIQPPGIRLDQPDTRIWYQKRRAEHS